MTETQTLTPAQALAELHLGNRRFVTGTRIHPNQDAEYRTSLADTQQPFAVLFGCSDSRLAAEIIFDRGLGDLFVVRTIGHTYDTQVLGSLEYAVTVLHAPLVVVLGHNSCGAVRAARETVRTGIAPPGHLGAAVEAVTPSVRYAVSQGIEEVDEIVDLHIRRTVEELPRHSAPLASAIAAGSCGVVGLSYHLAAGEVRDITTIV